MLRDPAANRRNRKVPRRSAASVADAGGPWETPPVIREPAEVSVEPDGRVELPLGLLAEAGINVGDDLLAFSDGDGRIVLRRASDAIDDLLNQGTL